MVLLNNGGTGTDWIGFSGGGANASSAVTYTLNSGVTSNFET